MNTELTPTDFIERKKQILKRIDEADAIFKDIVGPRHPVRLEIESLRARQEKQMLDWLKGRN